MDQVWLFADFSKAAVLQCENQSTLQPPIVSDTRYLILLQKANISCTMAPYMAETKTKKTATKTASKAAPKATKKAPTKEAAPKAAANKASKTMAEDFSVIETGGKQYIVSVGDVLEVELLGEHKEGDKVTFDQVLLSDNGKDVTVGTPYIKGAKVIATYLKEKKGPKITIIRYKAKSNRNRKQGHRQHYAQVKIESL